MGSPNQFPKVGRVFHSLEYNLPILQLVYNWHTIQLQSNWSTVGIDPASNQDMEQEEEPMTAIQDAQATQVPHILYVTCL